MSNRKMQARLLFALLWCCFALWAPPAPGQTPDEELDSVQSGAVSQNSPTPAQQEGWNKRSATNIGKIIGTVAGLTLGPVGALGGYFVGKYIDDMTVRKRVEELKGDRPDADSIEAWKNFIYRKYGVSPIDSESSDYKEAVDATGNKKNGSIWKKEELVLVNEVFKALPPDFYQETVDKLIRCKVDGDVFGCVYDSKPKSVFLFDMAYDEKLAEAKRKALFQFTLVHEMTHNFQKGTAGKALASDFHRKFWVFATGPAPVPGEGAGHFRKIYPANLKVFLRAQAMAFDGTASPPDRIAFDPGMYPLGCSVSQYGSRSSKYLDPWNTIEDDEGKKSKGYHWGDEDMAETVGLLFLNPEALKKDFPKRYAHFAPHFPSMAAGPARFDRETLTEAGSLFFAWKTPKSFTINAEHYPFTLFTFLGHCDWMYFPAIDDGAFGDADAPPPDNPSDYTEYLLWLRGLFEQHLPGPADCTF